MVLNLYYINSPTGITNPRKLRRDFGITSEVIVLQATSKRAQKYQIGTSALWPHLLVCAIHLRTNQITCRHFALPSASNAVCVSVGNHARWHWHCAIS